MEIIKLPPGSLADEDTDCIKIDKLPDGRFSLVTSALVETEDSDDDDGDSAAVVSSDSYDTYEAAEAAGLAWASEMGVHKVYVETGARVTGE